MQFDMLKQLGGPELVPMVEMLKKSYEQIGGSFVVPPPESVR